MPPLLSVKDLTLRRDDGTGSALFSDVSFEVNEGDIIIIKGRSGSGKTTLLKCLAQLSVYQKGEVLFRGKKPEEYGIPSYRTKVLYVPQRPSLLPNSPADFLAHIQSFASRSSSSSSSSSSWLPSFLQRKQDISLDDGDDYDSKDEGLDPYELAKKWNVPRELWNRGWGDLSGGESQRIALACALGRGNGLGGGGEIVLLDEPTSALDPETSAQVEESLLALLPPSTHNPSGKGSKTPGSGGPKAYLLITHSQEQADRLAGKGAKVVNLSSGQDTPLDQEDGDEEEEERIGNGRNEGKKAKNSSSSQV
ncbi:P-loop containing nucleoside triphosphate hydrolase protein [Mrakia frigida]|uniref:ABC transporter ATP-binding protein n=1 Tax=Mrakia frigida TaxID=29902 RepID=UPI003FCBFCD2